MVNCKILYESSSNQKQEENCNPDYNQVYFFGSIALPMSTPRLVFALAYLLVGVVLGVASAAGQERVTASPSVAATLAASATPAVRITPVPSLTPVPSPAPTTLPEVPHTGAQAHILMYHYIRQVDAAQDPLGFDLSITPEALESQLQAMQAAGYQFITMSDLLAGKGSERAVVLTFDDGYADFYTSAFPILQKYAATATQYVITDKIGGPYLSWDQIKELDRAGIEIGAHTQHHLDLSRMTAQQQAQEILGSKQALETQLGHPVSAFCYPAGRYNDETVRQVRAANFTSATTTESGTVYSLEDPYRLKRIRMSPDRSPQDLLHSLAH